MESRSSCEGEEGSSSIGSAILGADGSSQESEKLTDMEQRGEEGNWEMGLKGRRGDVDGLGSVVCKGDGFVPRGRWLLVCETQMDGSLVVHRSEGRWVTGLRMKMKNRVLK